MDTKHVTLRMPNPLFEELEALKPKEISMSAWLLQYIERGRVKPASIHEERATREVSINRMVHQMTHDEMIAVENDKSQDTFHLSRGQLTFNDIIEKHKVELDKKYK